MLPGCDLLKSIIIVNKVMQQAIKRSHSTVKQWNDCIMKVVDHMIVINDNVRTKLRSK